MAANQAVFHSIITPLDSADKKFFLKEVEGVEEISGLFCYRAMLATDDSNVDFSLLVGKSVLINLNLEGDQKRYISGIVSRLVQEETGDDNSYYRAEIRPWLWFLTLTGDCRIFQDKTVPEIIEKLFGEYSFSKFKNSLTGTYTKRVYSVQYRESVFDYISRLMEEEGIFYFFEHTDEGHTMVIADDSTAFKPCPNQSTTEMVPAGADDWEREGYLSRIRLEQEVTTDKYSLDDFNFEIPDTDLQVNTTGKSGELSTYDYPGGFQQLADGESLAKKRLESFGMPGKHITGKGYCRTFTPGFTFTLKKHKRADLNATYVIKQNSLKVTQDEYNNTFIAFSDSQAFRPATVTKKPKVFGSQTAIVVGKSGEEIWTDKYGRVKVQFHWDQEGSNNENSSCWIRVAHGWAGKSFGSIFIPRIGQEVVVSFLEGDADQPIITGSVYNAQQVVPMTLPADQTQSMIKTNSSKGGGGFNQILLEDKKDSEQIFMHAQKDMEIEIENDLKINVKKSNETHDVKGTRKVTVTGEETHTNKANFTQKVAGNYTLKVDGNLNIEATGITVIKGSMVKIN